MKATGNNLLNKDEAIAYFPEDFKNLRYNSTNKCWEVLIKWRDYDETFNTWEDTQKFMNVDDYQFLIPNLLKHSVKIGN